MPLKYPTEQDAKRRLDKSFLFYKNKPYFCRYAGLAGPRMLNLYDVRDTMKIIHTVPYDDPDISIAIPRLGYFNNEKYKKAMYLTRMPQRNQRDGLPYECLMINKHFASFEDLQCKGLEDMLIDKYPSIDKAIAKIKTHKSCAFSKDYILRSDMSIMYADRILVGKVIWDNNFKHYDIRFDFELEKLSFFMRNLNEVLDKLRSIKHEIN